MSCSQCKYLRETIQWNMCCICKLKQLRSKNTVRVLPYTNSKESENSTSLEMINVRRTGSHNSIVFGSQEYEKVLEFRKKYSKEELID